MDVNIIENSDSEITCRRCGYCCHFFADGKLRKCKHLVVLNGKTLCRIFNVPSRVGLTIYKSESVTVKCNFIDNVQTNYFGCPYNARKNIRFGTELPMFEYCIPWINANLSRLEKE